MATLGWLGWRSIWALPMGGEAATVPCVYNAGSQCNPKHRLEWWLLYCGWGRFRVWVPVDGIYKIAVVTSVVTTTTIHTHNQYQLFLPSSSSVFFCSRGTVNYCHYHRSSPPLSLLPANEDPPTIVSQARELYIIVSYAVLGHLYISPATKLDDDYTARLVINLTSPSPGNPNNDQFNEERKTITLNDACRW